MTNRVLTLTLNPALDLTVRADGWQRGEVNSAQELHWAAGGKGVNVASFLADWARSNQEAGADLSISAAGLLGADNAGEFERLFSQKGLHDAFLRVPGATRVGVKLVDGASQETTDLNLPGLTVTPEQLRALEGELEAHLPSHDVFVLAGSLPPGVPQDFYARWTARLRGQGKFVALDTSGPALAAVLGASTLPQLLKPNRHELSAALGRELRGEDDLLNAAHSLLGRGAELVAISQGEEGALFVSPSGAVRARPPRVQVVSTVGAGDAMVAGLVSAHLDGLALPDAARRATAFSLGAITRPGAHLPPPAELLAFAQQVQVGALPPR